MPEAKESKVESAESFPTAENCSDDDDDDLFISVWDGKSSKNTSSTSANTNKSKPKSLPNATSTASGFTNSRPNDGSDDKNGIIICMNNPSSSEGNSRNIQDHKSSTNKDLKTFRSVNGQASSLGVGSQNSSCSAANNKDKKSCSGYATHDLINKDCNDKNDLDLIAIDGDHTSSSGVVSNGLLDIKNEARSTPSDWDKPSCSGINIRDFDLYEDSSSLEADVCRLKIMFPSLDEEVLKSYVASYRDFEECVRVISTFMFGDDDDIIICEDKTPTNASVNTGKTNQNVNCPNTADTQENNLLSSNKEKNKGVEDSSEEKGNENHKMEIADVKSQRDLGDHENKTPLRSNSREVTSNLASNSSLRTRKMPPRSVEKKHQKTSSKESSLNVTKTSVKNQSKSQKSDMKVNQMDTNSHTNSLSSSSAVQVGIDIRFGKNKVHPSMKRCIDRSVASRDIAQPYKRNPDTKTSCDAHVIKIASSTDAKRPSDNSSDQSSPSKRVCKDSLATTTSNSPTISSNAATPSRTSSTQSVSNSSSSTSHGPCSTDSALTTSTYTIARSSSSLASASTSRNSSEISASSTPSKTTFGQTLKNESLHNSSTGDNSVAPSTSGSASEDATTDMKNRSQAWTDLSSVIKQLIGVNTRMLGSQGSPVSNQSTAGIPSGKGKGPKSSTLAPASSSMGVCDQPMYIDWQNVGSQSTVHQPQSSTAIKTQPSIVSQETKPNSGNQDRTTTVPQENQNRSSSPTNLNMSLTGFYDFSPENVVLVVKKGNSDGRECSGSSSSSHLADPSQREELAAEEEVARQEMLDLQRDTEMLAKVCPDSDPNFIFSRLEELKDKPNRVAIVNRELIENASTSQPEDAAIVIQKQKKIVWFWEDKKMRRIPFSRAESNIIESEYSKHNGVLVRVKFTPETLDLWFNFDSMALRETLGDKIRHVYRTESIEESTPGKAEDDKREETGLFLPPLSNPEIWHGHSSSTNNTNTALSRELFQVLPGTSEFAHVAGLLKKSLLQAEIKKIKRVKNDWLERKYGIQRGLLREKNGPAGINEMELFHGTRNTPPSVVWNSEEGFDMRYSADGMWGRGCYFAVHAAYSHHQFTHQYIHKQKRYYQIFLAHVLTGEAINMQPDRSIRKPPLNVATDRHYDSVTGITQGHRIYVLYKNEASFPAYLITYSM